MKKLKNVLGLLVITAIIFSFASCKQSTGGGNDQSVFTSADLKSLSIGGVECLQRIIDEDMPTFYITTEEDSELKIVPVSKTAMVSVQYGQTGNIYTANIKLGENKVFVKVKDGSKEKNYNFILYQNYSSEESRSCLLKNLTVDKDERLPFESTKYAYESFLEAGEILITADPIDPAAKVLIDGKDSTAADFGRINLEKDTVVAIEVQNGYAKLGYSISFKIVDPSVKIKLNFEVLESVGGSAVKSSTFKVYKYKDDGTVEEAVYAEGKVSNGRASVSLEPNHLYDIEFIGKSKEYSGSLIQHYYVNAEPEQELLVIQKEDLDHTRNKLPPKLTDIVMVIFDGSNTSFEPLEKTIVENCTGIGVQIKAPSAGVEMQADGSFGVKMSIGNVPNENIGLLAKALPGTSVYDPTEKVFITECFFAMGSELPNGKHDLVIVAYDIAGNRLEYHHFVETQNNTAGNSLDNSFFAYVGVESQTSKQSLNIFSTPEDKIISVLTNKEFTGFAMPEYLGENTTCLPIIYFAIVEPDPTDPSKVVPVEIRGFDVYRRAESEGEFKKVGSQVYGGLKSFKEHVVVPSSSGLEVGKVYEYKVVAYTDSVNRKESPVFKGEILKPFGYNLITPKNNQVLSLEEAKKIDFSCKISEPSLIRETDRLRMGLIVRNFSGEPIFAFRGFYFFDRKDENGKSLGPDLKIGDGFFYDYVKAGLLPAEAKLEDYVKIDPNSGVLKFTTKLLENGDFNIVDGTALELKRGETYSWDIQDPQNPFNVNDDWALVFIKVHPFMNSGVEQISLSASVGGNRKGADNGQCRFTIK